MDILTALHTRRSVRQYTDANISRDDVRVLLDAAMIAPSAGNARPWQFIVVDDPALLAKVPDIHPYVGMAAGAPLGILVCGEPAAEKYPGYWVQDCSAAVQNLLLAAVGLGLGAVWTGVYPVEERVSRFRALLSLPETIVPLAFIVIGHTNVAAEKKSRYEPEKIHHNGWALWKDVVDSAGE